jgi:DNA repair protein RecO (recombination protein O)
MYETMRGVVLHTLKYSDKNSIVHIFTDMKGRMSFLLPQGATRGARMRNAMFMPLSIVEFEARITPGRDICTLRDARSLYALTTVYGDPVKNAVATFVSELLTRSILESERNDALFRYLQTSITLLDRMSEGVANFHICFLYNFGVFLGIQPDTGSYEEGRWFDMENGVFTRERPPHHNVLNPEEAKTIVMLSRMNFSNLQVFRFSREERNRVLDLALTYYRLHNSMIGAMRSPEVLKQLFD